MQSKLPKLDYVLGGCGDDICRLWFGVKRMMMGRTGQVKCRVKGKGWLARLTLLRVALESSALRWGLE